MQDLEQEHRKVARLAAHNIYTSCRSIDQLVSGAVNEVRFGASSDWHVLGLPVEFAEEGLQLRLAVSGHAAVQELFHHGWRGWAELPEEMVHLWVVQPRLPEAFLLAWSKQVEQGGVVRENRAPQPLDGFSGPLRAFHICVLVWCPA